MSVAAGRIRHGRRRARPFPVVGALVSTAALFATAAVGLGRALAPTPLPSDPILAIRTIPVSTENSPAGALAAADNAVAIAYNSVEGDPSRDVALIAAVYAPSIRTSALGGAAAVRAQNAASAGLWARGGHNLSLIGARRLDYYDATRAEVSTWSANIYWGPGRSPKQSWALTQTQLVWSGERWLVTGTTTLPTGGPVPALTPQATSRNDNAASFDASLRGFTAPVYGVGG